jgi:hypothetical protein
MRFALATSALSFLISVQSLNCFASELELSKLVVQSKMKQDANAPDSYDDLLDKCFATVERSAKLVETCNATARDAAPRWYESPEAAWFLFSLGASLGFFAGQRLK